MPIAEINLLKKLVRTRQFVCYAAEEIEAGRCPDGVVDFAGEAFGDRGLMYDLQKQSLARPDPLYEAAVARLAAAFQEAMDKEMDNDELRLSTISHVIQVAGPRVDATSKGTGANLSREILGRQAVVLAGHLNERVAYDALARALQKRGLIWRFRLKAGLKDTFGGRLRRLQQEAEDARREGAKPAAGKPE